MCFAGVYKFVLVWIDALHPSQQVWSCRDGVYICVTNFIVVPFEMLA